MKRFWKLTKGSVLNLSEIVKRFPNATISTEESNTVYVEYDDGEKGESYPSGDIEYAGYGSLEATTIWIHDLLNYKCEDSSYACRNLPESFKEAFRQILEMPEAKLVLGEKYKLRLKQEEWEREERKRNVEFAVAINLLPGCKLGYDE